MATLRNKKRSKEQGFALIEAFEKSGLKPVSFCAQKNINYCVFRYWFSKARKKSIIKKSEGSFLPIKLDPAPSIPSKTSLRISLNSSITVEIPSGVDMVAFRQILEACRDVANR